MIEECEFTIPARHMVSSMPSPCRQRPMQLSISSSSRDVIPAPIDCKMRDPLLHSTVRKTFKDGTYNGQVVNIELDARTGQRAYHVVYQDGDEEHMSGVEVESYMVKRGIAANMVGRRCSAPPEFRTMLLPQLQLQSDTGPPLGALTQRITHEQPGGFRSWHVFAVCALSVAVARASPLCWTCMVGAPEPWEEQMPPPAVPAWEVQRALGAPYSAPRASLAHAATVESGTTQQQQIELPESPSSIPPWHMQPVPRDRMAHSDMVPPAIPPWNREELATGLYTRPPAQTQQSMGASAQSTLGSSGARPGAPNPALPHDQEESIESAANELLLLQAPSALFAWLSESEDENSAYSNTVASSCLCAGVLVVLLGICWGNRKTPPGGLLTSGVAVISGDDGIFPAADLVPPVGSPVAGRLSGASPFVVSPAVATPDPTVQQVVSPAAATPDPRGQQVVDWLDREGPLAATPVLAPSPATTPTVAALAAPPTPAVRRRRSPRSRSPRPTPLPATTDNPASSNGAAGPDIIAEENKPRSRYIQTEKRFRYMRQLRKFEEMGFRDSPELRNILTRCQGNISAACRELG